MQLLKYGICGGGPLERLSVRVVIRDEVIDAMHKVTELMASRSGSSRHRVSARTIFFRPISACAAPACAPFAIRMRQDRAARFDPSKHGLKALWLVTADMSTIT